MKPIVRNAALTLIAVLVAAVIYVLFLYTPYSSERVAENWDRAKRCDNEAITYLADYYEKKGQSDRYLDVIRLGAECKKQWAIDYLNSLNR